MIRMTARTHVLIVAGAMISMLPATQGDAAARPARPKLEARIAELKAKTAALVASAQASLNALSPQQRLSAPPAVWKVPGAVTAFKDCAGCPRMVVIPAGEFTMGSPPSEQQAEAQHRVTITAPFAVAN
jgi:formylglycine-generating enzyme required for sulfatase activity